LARYPRRRRASTIDKVRGDVTPSQATILLVEDDPDDAALTERALQEGMPARFEVARDGQEAMDYLSSDANDVPQLVLLDLGLPGTGGVEVLRRIRENERTSVVPVVILTSSYSPDDLAAAYRYGANSYVRKPADFDHFTDVVRQLGRYWLGVNEPPPDSLG
jgi:CheY-like chemotaxis protein